MQRTGCASPPHPSSPASAVHAITCGPKARRHGSSVLTSSIRSTIGRLVASPPPFQLHAQRHRRIRVWSQCQALVDVHRPPCVTQTRPTTTRFCQNHHTRTKRGVPKVLSFVAIPTAREDAAFRSKLASSICKCCSGARQPPVGMQTRMRNFLCTCVSSALTSLAGGCLHCTASRKFKMDGQHTQRDARTASWRFDKSETHLAFARWSAAELGP